MGDAATCDEGDVLCTAEAAELLGVAAATLKRWADAGMVRCRRTAGGHRRFGRGELEEVRARDASAGPLEGWVRSRLDHPDAALAAALLAEHERVGCWSAVADGLGPVLAEVEVGATAREAGAAVTARRLVRALSRCCEAYPPRATAPAAYLVALGPAAPLLALSFAELCMRERGWRPIWAAAGEELEEALCAAVGKRGAIVFAAALCAPGDAPAEGARRLAEAAEGAGIPLLALPSPAHPPAGLPGRALRRFGELRAFMEAREAVISPRGGAPDPSAATG